jgi:TonB family protein
MQKIFIVIGLIMNISLFAQGVDKEDYHIPRNIGGKPEFKRLFEQELIYPENALKNNIGGKVELQFDIMPDSSVADVKVLKSVDPELDKEALRISKMFQWIPARDVTGNIKASAYLTFNFQQKKYADLCKKRGYTVIEYPKYLPVDSSMTIYNKVDEYPVYPKGGEALAEFIGKNIQYPSQMATMNISGKVVLSYIVEPSGFPSNIGVEKALGAGCDEEAARILGLIKWKPGVKKGKIVRTKTTMTIPFVLSTSYH